MGSAGEGRLDFASIKSSSLRSKKLFEDPDFPAGQSAIGGDSPTTGIKWLRPKDICPNPQFFVQGASRFDLHQGNLGNCWFIAAAACLASSHQQLFDWCVPPKQEFDRDYAGAFRFNFWQFGTWVEVIVDDLLPCEEVNKGGQKNVQLIYASNKSQPNEFWVPLFEKAYAKLNGSYKNLDSGLINDALVDFTGGISERIDMAAKRRSPGNLFETLDAMLKMASLIGTHIIIPQGTVRKEPNGLYTGHAYSVTEIEQLRGTKNRLMRIRNPWGHAEWNGPWSDGSKEWATVPDDVKREIEFEKLDDGEFWISFDDWLKNFNRMAMCHLSPDAIAEEISNHKGKKMWNEVSYRADWVPGISAGGSGGFSNNRMFWTNPQFPITVEASNRIESGTCHVVVSLMQKATNNQYSLFIGFGVFKLNEGVAPRSVGDTYEQKEVSQIKMEACLPFREVSGHYQLGPGNYVIVPCTQFSNTAGEFLLRIYNEV